jgi:diaminohydroxyphosphoribosylaminopyrimidine deaminase/5-amino-6-(5-phosphoribosylamino)uracil reductase
MRPDLQSRLRDRGVTVLEFPRLTPDQVMQALYDQDLNTVLWECGGVLAAQAIRQGAVQKLWAFIAPKIIGGQAAPSPVDDLGLVAMTDAIALDSVQWRTVGHDLLMEGYLRSERIATG